MHVNCIYIIIESGYTYIKLLTVNIKAVEII